MSVRFFMINMITDSPEAVFMQEALQSLRIYKLCDAFLYNKLQ